MRMREWMRQGWWLEEDEAKGDEGKGESVAAELGPNSTAYGV